MKINTSIEDGETVECKCGGIYRYDTFRMHLGTKRHKRWVSDMIELRGDF
jgi:hypothetical protein